MKIANLILAAALLMGALSPAPASQAAPRQDESADPLSILVDPANVPEFPQDAIANIPNTPSLLLTPIGVYATSVYNQGASEISAFDPISDTLYIVNGAGRRIDVVSIVTPTAPTLLNSIAISPTYGAAANSVAISGDIVAVAVEAPVKTDSGLVVFFDRATQALLNQVPVGALPDMLTFTPAPNPGRVLVANEGEPNDSYTIDPEGSVTVINITDIQNPTVLTATFGSLDLSGLSAASQLRFTRPTTSTVAQNVEPEYIAIDPGGFQAYVTLQENNAVAVIDINSATVTRIDALGFKDHNVPGRGLDASDRDVDGTSGAGGRINVTNWPVLGMYQPDAITAYDVTGDTYLVMANEGDARAYPAWNEEVRVNAASYLLDGALNAALKTDVQLGRLQVSNQIGDTDSDGDFDQLYAFGARSFSIRDSFDGSLIFDSGNHMEEVLAFQYPAFFNASNTNNTFDSRSPAKGPEPEGVTLGVIGGRTYAFIGLERIGGVMVYDITDPTAVTYVGHFNNRNFGQTPGAGTGGDLGPEGLTFIAAADSPIGVPLLVLANEISGSTTVYRIDPTSANGAGRLTLLHNNDGESSLLPITNTVNLNTGFPNTTTVNLPIGGVAAYDTLVNAHTLQAGLLGGAKLNVYAGDAFLASGTLVCSFPVTDTAKPVYDAIAQREIDYDAHVLGNHEFDYTPDFLARFVNAFTTTTSSNLPTQPFLSANLGNWASEPGLNARLDADGLINPPITDGNVIGRAMIYTDTLTGQRFGLVGATTPLLPTISSPRGITVTVDITATAQVVQAEINRLQSFGVTKIILVSHMQDVSNDRLLIQQLNGVDLAVAGGGDELLQNPIITNTLEFLPGETQAPAGTYPLTQLDAGSRTVYIVTTAGNYKYLGRLDVEFNTAGEVSRVIQESSFPRRVTPTSSTATALRVFDAVAKDPTQVSAVETPVQACLNDLAATPVARTEVLFDVARNSVRGRESNGGNLVADAFLYQYDQLAASTGLPPRSAGNIVVAVQNGGGIRQNAGDILPVGGGLPGIISRLNTIDVLPFDNYVTVITNVTPSDVKTIFERSAASLPGFGGQFLQVSGLTVTLNISNPVNSRVVSVQLANGIALVSSGQPVASAPTIAIVTNNFTAGGGDNYPTFANNPNKINLRKSGGQLLLYEEALRLYLQSFPVQNGLPTVPASDARYALTTGQGRIVISTTPPTFRLWLPIVAR